MLLKHPTCVFCGHDVAMETHLRASVNPDYALSVIQNQYLTDVPARCAKPGPQTGVDGSQETRVPYVTPPQQEVVV